MNYNYPVTEWHINKHKALKCKVCIYCGALVVLERLAKHSGYHGPRNENFLEDDPVMYLLAETDLKE